jgi:hypothetical protein
LAAGDVFSFASALAGVVSAGAFSLVADFSVAFVAAGVSCAWQRLELIMSAAARTNTPACQHIALFDLQ